MILYNIALILYNLGLRTAALFHPKAQDWVKGRQDLFDKLQSTIAPSDRIAWFHCASLGEFEQGRPVIEAFRQRYPHFKILLTFFSPSGYNVRKDYPLADYIFYLPLDTHRNATRFIEIAHPEVAIFVKYEFWIHLLQQLRQKKVRTYIISAIFRPSQLFFKPYGKYYRHTLTLFDHLFVQNKLSADLLHNIGINNCSVCGDTRFDRVYQIAHQAPRIEILERFSDGQKVFITGSSWEKDDQITIELADKHRQLKFVIAPHELGEEKITQLVLSLQQKGRTVLRYTSVDAQSDLEQADVLIIDTIGILSSVYRYGYCAYIGGGFGVGIHNTLEAATFGLPLIFGPNYHRFDEACGLIECGAAQSIVDARQADQWLCGLLAEPLLYKNKAEASRKLVHDNIGATDTILQYGLVEE